MTLSELFCSARDGGYCGIKKFEKIVDFFITQLGFQVEFKNGLYFVNETKGD